MVSECLGGTMGIVCGIAHQFIGCVNGCLAPTGGGDPVALQCMVFKTFVVGFNVDESSHGMAVVSQLVGFGIGLCHGRNGVVVFATWSARSWFCLLLLFTSVISIAVKT